MWRLNKEIETYSNDVYKPHKTTEEYRKAYLRSLKEAKEWWIN